MQLRCVLISTLVIQLCRIIPSADCSCSLPSSFAGSWWDSRTNGAINISSLQVTTGWELTLFSQQYSTYTCIHSDSDHWVFRSDQTILGTFGGKYYAVFCLQFTKVTDNSYYYYIRSDKEPLMLDKRVLLVDVVYATGLTTLADYCTIFGGPDDREYNVLVKASSYDQFDLSIPHMQSMVHVNSFPDALLGVFYYTVNNGTSSSCGIGSVLDGCFNNAVIDRTTITVNYSLCSTRLMGSTNGRFYHVTSVIFSSTYYTMLINADGTDIMFTCIAVTQSGKTRSISTNPGGCAEGQVSTNRTSNSRSQLIMMTEYETCYTNFTDTTTTEYTNRNLTSFAPTISLSSFVKSTISTLSDTTTKTSSVKYTTSSLAGFETTLKDLTSTSNTDHCPNFSCVFRPCGNSGMEKPQVSDLIITSTLSPNVLT